MDSDNSDNVVYNQEEHVEKDETYEVFKRENFKRLNDTNCKHPNLKRDDSDTIGDSVAWVCEDCGLGTFLPKTVKKII